MQLTISVFSDVICPWCYVGKRRLERAIDKLGKRESTAIEWLPFELNPDMPADGMERALYRARKFGLERSAQLDAQMTELGRQEGIGFTFDRITRTPSTRRAHMLIAAAGQQGRADSVVDALFHAYFEEGRDVGDPDVLREIGVAAGLERNLVDDALRNEQLRTLVESIERQASEMQVSGVPFFIRSGKRLPSRATEVAVHFKRQPMRSPESIELELDGGHLPALPGNVLVFRIQPHEGISLSFITKRPGMGFAVRPVQMDFDYGASFGQAGPDAYVRLLLDAMLGDPTLFARDDEIDTAWSLMQPILNGWADSPATLQLPVYEAGTWGPVEAELLMANDRRTWRRP